MHRLKTTRHWLMLVAAMLSLFSLAACQHTANEEASEFGQLTIELTDAEGDLNNYSVDVLSITLTKMDNTIVEVLPETTRVDFSQYVEMSELLSSADVPAGIYTSATLLLDYSNAEIFVENADGDNIQISNIVDENNQAISTLRSTVVLDERNRLRIAPGIPAHLSIDFDLKTSNIVSFEDPTAPVLTVSPVLNASLEPDTEKAHRIRGPLKSVNIDDNSFDLIIRPFHHHVREPRLANQREKFGSLRVNISDETSFEINTVSTTGADGLRAMNELDKFTAVIAFGEVSLNPRRFQATEVYVGTSVPGGDLDVVKGTVVSRIDNTLIIKGATLIRAGGSVIFNDEVTVMLDTTTIVKKQHDRNDYRIGAISVGQRVTVFGTLDEDSANLTLDASSGLVRLLVTAISGTVVAEKDSSTEQLFAINLARVSGRPINLLNFDGTGIDAENDADPSHYEINTRTLDLGHFPLNSSVGLRGFVNNFGAAPADFIATSISDRKHARKARMHTNWRPTSTVAFSLVSEEKITLDFSEAGRFHHVGNGKRRIDLEEQDTDFSLIPTGDNTAARYSIEVGGSLRVHTTFSNLSRDLNDLITNGSVARHIQATGVYGISTGEFTAKKIKIRMRQR